MKTRNMAVPAVYIFLVKDGKLLIARRHNTGYQDGNYQVPAGHVEEGELPTEAMIREAKEEVGIDVRAEDLKLLHVMYRPKHDHTGDRVDFFFKCENWQGEACNMEPHKCDDLRWVELDDLPENVTPHVREAVRCLREDKGPYLELDIGFFKEKGLYAL